MSELTTEQKLAALRERFPGEEMVWTDVGVFKESLTVVALELDLFVTFKGPSDERTVAAAYETFIAPERQRIIEAREALDRIAIDVRMQRIQELEQQLAEMTASRERLRVLAVATNDPSDWCVMMPGHYLQPGDLAPLTTPATTKED